MAPEREKENPIMAKVMFSDNAQVILNFLQSNPTVEMTARDLAEATQLPPRTVNGVVTGLARRGFAYRDAVELDGETVKYVRLTDEGMNVDPFAETE